MKHFTFVAPHRPQIFSPQLSEQNSFSKSRGLSLDCGFLRDGSLQQKPFSSIVRPLNIK